MKRSELRSFWMDSDQPAMAFGAEMYRMLMELRKEDQDIWNKIETHLPSLDKMKTIVPIAISNSLEMMPLDSRKEQMSAIGTLLHSELIRLLSWNENTGRYEPDVALVDDIGLEIKTTCRKNGWLIPRECWERNSFLVYTDRTRRLCSVGLLKLREEYLDMRPHPVTGKIGNRDGKVKINDVGLARIKWMFKDEPIPETGLRMVVSEYNSMAQELLERGLPAIGLRDLVLDALRQEKSREYAQVAS